MTFTKSDDPKRTTVQIRLTPTEKTEIENRAFECGETVSSYMLKSSLSRPIRNQSDRHEVNELRLFILSLKDLYHAGMPSDERLTPVLQAAVAALNSQIGRKRRDR